MELALPVTSARETTTDLSVFRKWSQLLSTHYYFDFRRVIIFRPVPPPWAGT